MLVAMLVAKVVAKVVATLVAQDPSPAPRQRTVRCRPPDSRILDCASRLTVH